MPVNETQAREMDQAITDFKNKDAQAARDQQVIDKATAQTWYDTTIEPTLLWNNTQLDNIQLSNTFTDRDTLEVINETSFRKDVLAKNIRGFTQRIRTIKARL